MELSEMKEGMRVRLNEEGLERFRNGRFRKGNTHGRVHGFGEDPNGRFPIILREGMKEPERWHESYWEPES